MALRFVENGFQLALCNRGWLTTQKFVIPVPDPIVFAPWSVLFDRGEPCVTAVKIRHALWCCVSLVPTPDHKSAGRAISWTQRSTGCSRSWSGRTARRAEPRNTTNNDTIKLRRDDGGGPKRGALHGSHNTVFPYRVKVCFYCVTSLAVLSRGSTVRVKTDALVVALFQNCSFHGVCVVGFSVANRPFDCGCCAETATSLATGARSH